MEFKKLTAQTLPEPNKIVWIKRGIEERIYLGYREDRPISTNEDWSKDCYWYGNSIDKMPFGKDRSLEFLCNFSDVTVDAWAELDSTNQ